jgi:hypothetical protein
MPITVNAEALRVVLNIADSLSANARYNKNTPFFNDSQREKLSFLETSIFLLRQSLEKYDEAIDNDSR